MSNKLFTEDEVNELKMSPYVDSVSKRSVVFTPQFKQMIYEHLCNGEIMQDILESYGINTAALGKARVNGLREKIEIAAVRDEGFSNLRKKPRQKNEQSESGSSLQKRILQLEHELAYTKQEVEFLKKVRQADTEALKSWEYKLRHK